MATKPPQREWKCKRSESLFTLKQKRKKKQISAFCQKNNIRFHKIIVTCTCEREKCVLLSFHHKHEYKQKQIRIHNSIVIKLYGFKHVILTLTYCPWTSIMLFSGCLPQVLLELLQQMSVYQYLKMISNKNVH